MNKFKRFPVKKVLMELLCSFFLFAGVASAGVTVYAEGAYTATDLVVYIYADITAPNLCSFGVKLTYPSSNLTVTSAEKNGAVWYLGSETYMDPDYNTTPGEIVFIGGKLDTSSPLAGVVGDRILLGKATFSRTESSMPFTGVISITYGRGPGTGAADEFNNFVAIADDGGGGVTTTVMDGSVSFSHPTFGVSVKIAERGDADLNGTFSIADMIEVRNSINSGQFNVFADCDGNGSLAIADMICVRGKI